MTKSTAPHYIYIYTVCVVHAKAYLYGLRRRVVVVVVRLVVLVPVVPRLDAVEVARLSRAELVVPPVCLRVQTKHRVQQSARAEGGRRSGLAALRRKQLQYHIGVRT